MVLGQLNAAGLVPMLQFRSRSFPCRVSFRDFLARFSAVSSLRSRPRQWRLEVEGSETTKARAHVLSLLSSSQVKAAVPTSDWRMGRTKVFFRPSALNSLRMLQVSCDCARCTFLCVPSPHHNSYDDDDEDGPRRHPRSPHPRCHTAPLRRVLISPSRCGVASLSWRVCVCAQADQRQRAAMVVQQFLRGTVCRQRYLQLCRGVVALQSHFRGIKARGAVSQRLQWRLSVNTLARVTAQAKVRISRCCRCLSHRLCHTVRVDVALCRWLS
jgi:hypothetical protein